MKHVKYLPEHPKPFDTTLYLYFLVLGSCGRNCRVYAAPLQIVDRLLKENVVSTCQEKCGIDIEKQK